MMREHRSRHNILYSSEHTYALRRHNSPSAPEYGALGLATLPGSGKNMECYDGSCWVLKKFFYYLNYSANKSACVPVSINVSVSTSSSIRYINSQSGCI